LSFRVLFVVALSFWDRARSRFPGLIPNKIAWLHYPARIDSFIQPIAPSFRRSSRRRRQNELSELEQTAGWTSVDAGVLARHADLFRAKAESMVDSWRAVIGAQPHLAHWFVKPDGTPDDA